MASELSPKQVDFLVRYLGIVMPGPASNAGDENPAAGIVEKRGFLVTRWKQIQAEIDVELKTLCTAIGESIPFEDPAEINTGVTRALGGFLDDIRTEINDAVDISVNAGDGSYGAVRDAVAANRARCAKSELIAALRENTLTDGKRFELAITDALDEVEQRLTA